MSESDYVSKAFKNGDVGGFVAVSLAETLDRLVEIGEELEKTCPPGSWEASLEQALKKKAIPVISTIVGSLNPESIEALQGIDELEGKIWEAYWELMNDPECPPDFSIFTLLGKLIIDPPLAPVLV